MVDIFKSKKSVREHLITLTKELIRFPSHAEEPLKIHEAMEFIKEYFAGDKLHFAHHTINGFPALVITTEGTKHPHIMLSGHVDVVTSSTQFTAKVDDDKLYGSGAMDMKSGLACIMAVMKYFAKQKDKPSLGLMITSDEETGGKTTKVLLEDEGYHTDFCIINEGRHRYDLVIREKGMFIVKVTLKGKSIHSAYPWKVSNVIERLMKFCTAIKEQFPAPKDAWIPTVSVTHVQAGREYNTIPGSAEAVLCFRLVGKKWTREKVVDVIREMVPDAEIEDLVYGEIFQADQEEEHIQALKKVINEVTRKKVRFGENHGASDARYFYRRNIPTVVLGPVGKDHHTQDEYVLLSSVFNHFFVLKKFIDNEQKSLIHEAKKLGKGK